ncbi:hypothetical protein M514_10571, partial [Trichuris suis]
VPNIFLNSTREIYVACYAFMWYSSRYSERSSANVKGDSRL